MTELNLYIITQFIFIIVKKQSLKITYMQVVAIQCTRDDTHISSRNWFIVKCIEGTLGTQRITKVQVAITLQYTANIPQAQN